MNDEFHKSLPSKTEAINQLEELVAACSKSRSDRRDKVTKSLRDRGQRLDQQWSDLESDLDEYRSLTAKESRKQIQAILRSQSQMVEELKDAIKSSGDATDAEELSENVDVSLQKINLNGFFKESGATFGQNHQRPERE